MPDKPIIKLNDVTFNYPTDKPSLRIIYLQEVISFEIKWPHKLPETFRNEIIIGELIDLYYY